LKDEQRNNSKSAAASRIQDARVAEIEMRNAIARREYVPVDDAQAAIDIVVGRVKSELTGLPARVTRDLDQRRKLETEVNGSLKRIADELAASAEYFAKGGDLPSTSGEDDA
jgi:hypothetical protein